VERLERAFQSLGEEFGIAVEVHGGHMHSSGQARMEALVGRADLVVVVTGVNSHNAVHAAKRYAARRGREVRILKSCGLAVARSLILEFARSRGLLTAC
jgi:hypothetical protein